MLNFRSKFFSSYTKVVIADSNMVLGVLCACGLPVRAIAEEIEILGLPGLSVPNLRHLETSSADRVLSKDASMPCA